MCRSVDILRKISIRSSSRLLGGEVMFAFRERTRIDEADVINEKNEKIRAFQEDVQKLQEVNAG